MIKNHLHNESKMYHNVNIMKIYNLDRIKDSEILQLLILHHLYGLKESKLIYFQGGTAIRWCYNGGRFSEDLDFTTTLGKDSLMSLVETIIPQLKRTIMAHFGPGLFEFKWKTGLKKTTNIADFRFLPEGKRRKIYVKSEFEELKEGIFPDTEKFIFNLLPSVRTFIDNGLFRIPYSSTVLIVQTKEEIFSDKIRALLERRYLKGRDFYDLWFLYSNGTTCTVSNLKRKLKMYKSQFIMRRKVDFFIKPDKKAKKEILDALRNDLSRFLSPEEFNFHLNRGFKDIFEVLKRVFRKIKESIDE